MLNLPSERFIFVQSSTCLLETMQLLGNLSEAQTSSLIGKEKVSKVANKIKHCEGLQGSCAPGVTKIQRMRGSKVMRIASYLNL